MESVFKWLDAIPLLVLLVLAVMFALAPMYPEPHLLEKTRMLFTGQLGKPLDIFDLLMHATPMLLLIIRLFRLKRISS